MDPDPYNAPRLDHKTYLHKYKLGYSERIVYALYLDKQHCTIVYVGDREDINYPKLPDIAYDEMVKKEVAGTHRGHTYRGASSVYWPEFGRPYYRYMTSECYDFALALLEQFPALSLVGLGGMNHVALTDGSHYFDVRGQLTEDDFRDGLADGDHASIVPVALEDVQLHAGLAGATPPYESDELDAARDVVAEWSAWLETEA